MLKSGFMVCCSILLTIVCWLAPVAPSAALSAAPVANRYSSFPYFLAPTEIAMANKSLFSFSGKRPNTLGVKDGKLAACPGTPNCVSSQASDLEHRVEAIAYTTSASEALAKLKSVIESMERAAIVEESNHYLYAEFTSGLMGFVDDVEFYLDDAAKVIHIRSASRLGQSDLGMNRKRVEEIRAKWA
ncbi:MAG: DUF1499 domain-containing protein [Leptolyngbyaceae cyanobacterium CSU_1_4]|nr:DUF1499 domain-containing protein [Leptolyngbyaceae cyanobacterium CSU_1_4]